ncbi:MAG: GUN4 domain-containing protein [Okeania sp. SIO3C4]|nr:GUN4 domain-containing protein [Okeania sp. SIO3C4]
MKFLPRILGLTFLALTLTNFASLQRSWSEEKPQTLQQAVERVETGVEPLAVSGEIPVNLFQEYQGRAANKTSPVLAQSVDYTKLRNLLAAGKWGEADRETHSVMTKVVTKVMGELPTGIIEIPYMESFPCEDLATMDKLWVKYSDGKFGFSVQKQIYQSLGGMKKYNNDKVRYSQEGRKYHKEVWRAFISKVGWSHGRGYVHKKPNTPLYVGSHPISSGWVSIRGAGDWGFLAVIQRLEECGI